MGRILEEETTLASGADGGKQDWLERRISRRDVKHRPFGGRKVHWTFRYSASPFSLCARSAL
jgi:hypothetical protein